MTWLTGTTTWGELENELTKLICGEKASSGNAATVTGSEKWVREETRTITGTVSFSGTTMTDSGASFTSADVGLLVLNSNVPGGVYISAYTNTTTVTLSAAATTASTQTAQLATNTVRTKTGVDVASGDCATRTGYFSAQSFSTQTSIRVSTPFSSAPTAGTTSGRWGVEIRLTTANSVAGNYSTVSAQYSIFDLDGIAASSTNQTLTFNSAGVATVNSGLQVTISDPSGIITAANTYYQRGFATGYLYGIDQWPMLYRASGASSFTIAPPGVAGTDYDVLARPHAPVIASQTYSYRGSLLHGLGIKTATGLGTGNLYKYAMDMSFIKARIFKSATVGQLSVDVGGSKRDIATPTTMRNIDGFRVTTWLRPFTTAGSVTTSSAVQYFMSVTSTGIVIALNGDTTNTGKLTTAWIGDLATYETTYDKFGFGFSMNAIDYTADQASIPVPATQFTYHTQKYRLDGTTSGARDWQTGWANCGHTLSGTATHNTASAVDQTGQGVAQSASTGAGTGAPGLYALGIYATVNTGSPEFAGAPFRQIKPAHDGKWWLYKYHYGQGYMFAYSGTGVASQAATDDRLVRGLTDRYYFIPDDNWASGDELTDPVTGIKYLLLKPDYMGVGTRLRSAANTFWGGIAIAQV